MKLTTSKPKIELSFTFTVSEGELRALDALAGYGDDAFIEAFYEKLGKAYMEDHESDLRLFLNSLRAFCPGMIAKVDEIKKSIAAMGATT